MTDASQNKDIAAYLAAFEREARRLRLTDWRGIAADVHGHINEAVDYGKPIGDVLRAMGKPEALARAYAMELAMQRPAGGGWLGPALRLTGLVAVGGVITLIVVVALGSVGVTLVFAGLVFLTAGLLEAANVHFSFVHLGGVSPWAFVAASPLILGVGLGALWLLVRYVRFAAGQLVRSVPVRAAA